MASEIPSGSPDSASLPTGISEATMSFLLRWARKNSINYGLLGWEDDLYGYLCYRAFLKSTKSTNRLSRKILHNWSVDFSRKIRGRTVRQGKDGSVVTSEPVKFVEFMDWMDSAYEDQDIVSEAVDIASGMNLSDRDLQAYRMYAIDDMTLKQIGARFNISESRVCYIIGDINERVREVFRSSQRA